MKLIFTILLISVSLITTGQERCGTEVYTKSRMNNNASYAIARNDVNAQTEKWIKNHPYHSEKTIITIAVVVHVVWKTNTHNISDAQIQSQIDVLNEDFRRTNLDKINTPNVWQTIAADVEIEFCLASIDPNGNASTGIERTQTSHGSFGMNNDIHTSSAGGADDWPNDDYLNIWVCDIESGLLGYASLPSNWISDGDGLVIGHQYFGRTGTVQSPYHKGRTATHEIGHWLNLDHIWGKDWGLDTGCDGDDNVADTPNQEENNFFCPGFPHNANACNTDYGDMFMNYMDYTNDACMNLFTNGQKTRMLASINQYRPNMLSHNLCGSSVVISEHINNKKKLIKIVDVLGRTSKGGKINIPLFYFYDNGTIEKKIIIK